MLRSWCGRGASGCVRVSVLCAGPAAVALLRVGWLNVRSSALLDLYLRCCILAVSLFRCILAVCVCVVCVVCVLSVYGVIKNNNSKLIRQSCEFVILNS